MENLSGDGQEIQSNEVIKKILLENQQILLEIKEQSQKTRKYILTGRIISFIYLILIVAPLLFAAFYLPPLIKNYLGPYQELLGQGETTGGLSADEINQLIKDLQQ